MLVVRVKATSLRVEDRLIRANNFGPWKERMVILLEEVEVWDIVENHVQPPIDPSQLVEIKNKNVKVRRIILDAINAHLFPHMTRMKFVYDMWDSLITLH